MRICARSLLRKNRCFGKLPDKYNMATQIITEEHVCAEKCIGVFCDILQPISRGVCILEFCELINITAGLHAEVPYYIKRHIIRQHRNIKFSAFFDHLSRVIAFLNRYHEPCRFRRNLNTGVNYTSVVLVILCGEYEYPVSKIECSFIIYYRLFLTCESIY